MALKLVIDRKCGPIGMHQQIPDWKWTWRRMWGDWKPLETGENSPWRKHVHAGGPIMMWHMLFILMSTRVEERQTKTLNILQYTVGSEPWGARLGGMLGCRKTTVHTQGHFWCHHKQNSLFMKSMPALGPCLLSLSKRQSVRDQLDEKCLKHLAGSPKFLCEVFSSIAFYYHLSFWNISMYLLEIIYNEYNLWPAEEPLSRGTNLNYLRILK